MNNQLGYLRPHQSCAYLTAGRLYPVIEKDSDNDLWIEGDRGSERCWVQGCDWADYLPPDHGLGWVKVKPECRANNVTIGKCYALYGNYLFDDDRGEYRDRIIKDQLLRQDDEEFEYIPPYQAEAPDALSVKAQTFTMPTVGTYLIIGKPIQLEKGQNIIGASQDSPRIVEAPAMKESRPNIPKLKIIHIGNFDDDGKGSGWAFDFEGNENATAYYYYQSKDWQLWGGYTIEELREIAEQAKTFIKPNEAESRDQIGITAVNEEGDYLGIGEAIDKFLQTPVVKFKGSTLLAACDSIEQQMKPKGNGRW